VHEVTIPPEAGIGALLPAPAGLSPATGAINQTLTPTLTWNAVANATSYRIMLAQNPVALPTDPTDANCDRCLVDKVVDITATYTPPTGVLTPGTTYYWQVHARSPTNFGAWRSLDSSGAWIDASIFTTAMPTPATLLPAPAPTTPANGATGLSTTPTLSWTPAAGAASYRIMIASNPAALTSDPTSADCAACVVNAIVSGGSSSTYVPDLGILAPDTTYYWSIKARSENYYGAWSPVRSFSTGARVLIGTVTEFSAGISGNPYDITTGPDGNLWFVKYDRIGRITPAGVVTEFSVGITPTAGPFGITAGPDGNLWFTEWGGGHIGRITPAGVVTEFSGVSGYVMDITTGVDGNLWFTGNLNYSIGRITPAGVVTYFSAGISGNPLRITTGPDGNLWFTDSYKNRIGRISPAGVVTEFSVGITANADLYDITAGPDGNLWFTERNGNRIGRITPSGVVTEFSVGITAGAYPQWITAGPDGNLWFTEWGVGRIGRITSGVGTTSYTLNVSSVNGTVTSAPAGIKCGANCWASFALGTPVTLTATPNAGSNFNGWSGGGCSGTGACQVTMNGATTVNATFSASTTPGAPIINGITLGDGSATISFLAPTNNGGNSITAYTATCSTAGQPTQTSTGPSSPLTVLGLTGGMAYSCAIAASNSIGTGAVLNVLILTPMGVTCISSLSPTSQSAAASATPGTLSVTSPSGCTWSASSNVAWIMITSGSNGSGNGTVAYAVAANPSSSSRIGTLTIAGETFTITQAALVAVPGAPTAVSANAGNTSIIVNFGAPASDGGAAITGYSATCTSSDGGVSGSNTGGASATSIQVGGLTNGKSYTCTVTASNSVGAGTPSANSNSVTPSGMTLQFSAPTYTVGESGPNITLSVTRTGGSAGAISVPWSTTNGTALAGTDFGTAGNVAQKSGTLSWAAGDVAAKTIVVGPVAAAGNYIAVINNTTVDGSRAFSVSLGSPTGGAVLGTTTAATVTITDNDSRFDFAAPTYTVAENGASVLLTVTRTGVTTAAAYVTYATANGTALAGTNFGTPGMATPVTGVLAFTAAQASKTISIPILNNTTIGGDKTFTVNLVIASGATVGAAKSAAVTIRDDDKGVKFAATALTVSEGTGNAILTVTRLGNASGAVSVSYATVNGTALAGQDYSATSGSLAWADGELGDKTITVPIIDDTLVEPSQIFSVTLSAVAGATLSGPGSATVTITDNDSNLQFSAPTASVRENGGNLVLTVTRTGTTTGVASVAWAAVDGSAAAGADYGTPGNSTPPSGTLNFAAGAASRTITLPILNDTVFEGNETFTVSLSAPTGATLGAVQQSAVTIAEDEIGLQFDQANYSEAEGKASIVLKVNRIGPAAAVMHSVRWTAANGTATAGQDYGVLNNATPPSGTLLWGAGDLTAKTITIPIINDALLEGDETFTVTLNIPSVGMVVDAAHASATVTIWDNDSPPESVVSFAAPKVVVSENIGTLVVPVTRTGNTARPVSVKYATVPGTALAASDFTARSGSLSWGALDAGVQTISIPIINDAIAESVESFTVTLSAPSVSLGLGDYKTLTVAIEDDDEVFPQDGKWPAGWTIPQAVPPAPVIQGWHVQEETSAAEGKYTLKTDTVFDNESAEVQLTGVFQAGNVSFRLKVSSEPQFDALVFLIDGVEKGRWSGNQLVNWVQTPNYAIAAGPHTLLWRYVKDGSISMGQDAAWIDAVVTPAVTLPPP